MRRDDSTRNQSKAAYDWFDLDRNARLDVAVINTLEIISRNFLRRNLDLDNKYPALS